MQTVELKPWRNGLLQEMLLVIPMTGSWDETWAPVEARLEEAKISVSLSGAQLTIDLGLRSVPCADLEWLVDRIRIHYGLLTVGVVSTDNVTRESAKRLTLSTYLMPPGGSRDSTENLSKSNALYLPQTVRSGQRIVHDGHVIIGGDVNAGAEVIAVGDIIVIGTLRGLAHAGSAGDESARIIAGSMRPNQLRIAAEIARSPEESAVQANASRRPEMARIENGAIQVFPV
jgi:septum site-determining protein MinC